MSVKQDKVYPSPDENGRECVITIKNTSASLTATNVSLNHYDSAQAGGSEVEDDYATGTDHILPGQTYSVYEQVYQNNCTITPSIRSAGIAKKSS